MTTAPTGRSAPPLAEALGPDLAALVAAWGTPLARVTEVTGLPSPVRARAAFRLEFADGSLLKGRRLRGPERAARVERLLARAGPGFSRILGRRGSALLLEWVDGPTLSSLSHVPPAALHAAGRLLARLHRIDVSDLPETPGPDLPELERRLFRNVRELVEADRLPAELAERTLAAAGASRPARAGAGVVHKDFCGENIVLHAGRGPVCIDNASLALGPLDLDLARSWARWPMRRDEFSAFLRGYEELRSGAGFRDHFRFWAVCALCASAGTRLRARAERDAVQTPLDRLRHLLEEEPEDAPWPG